MAGSDKGKGGAVGAIILGCIGILVVVLAAGGILAWKAFNDFKEASMTSEATSNLKALFVGASSYYYEERWTDEPLGAESTASGCTVDPAITSNTPGAHKSVLTAADFAGSFYDVGFSVSDPVYFQYEIAGPPGACGGAANRAAVYTMRTHGDLDGNGVERLIELGVGSSADNELYRSPQFRVVEEDGSSRMADEDDI